VAVAYGKVDVLRFRSQNGSLAGIGIRRTRRKMSSDEVYEVALAALERSEAILENVGDGVYSTDPRGQILLWNRSAQRVTGCPPNKARGHGCEAILGLRVGDAPLDCRNGCALLRMSEGKPAGTSMETIRTGDDGREQPLLVNVTAIKDPDGTVTEVVHSMRDITALKLADEAKTMFLATASHELKTPLTVILGFTQALRSDWLADEQRRDALQSIERRAQELSRIVDRLLLTGRIESGKISLELSLVDLHELVAERTNALAMVTGRTIVCDLPDDMPLVVADREAFTTIVDHLLDNAVKYSPDGGEIVVRAISHRNGVEIEVVDRGIGMNEEGTARCFERFWQAETSDVRRFGGTGVGLYIVRSLVEGMGGRIGVRSMLGKGTTFTMRLRRASDEDAIAAKKDSEPGVGKRTMIHEFMHQIGVPGGGGGGGS
jgi:PAS domain S-box-containing protein